MKNKALQVAANEADKFLNSLNTSSVATVASIEQLRAALDGKLPRQPRAAESVVEQLVEATRGGLIGSASGRFFAWVIGGSLDSSLAADWLTSTWDQNAALFNCSPAAAIVEEVVGEWLKELLDLPRESSFALTNGCQLAHFTCLAAARHAVLSQVGHDVHKQGLFAAPEVRVICGEQRHGSIDSVLRMLGFGNDHIYSVNTDATGQMDVAEFTELLKGFSGPKIVALGAGDINTGSFDDFQTLIPIAKDTMPGCTSMERSD